MRYLKTVSVCVATALAIAVYLLIIREEFHAHVFCDKNTYYAIIKYGAFIDTSAQLWIMEDNKWLVCYLGHEIDPGMDFNVKKSGNQVIVFMNNAAFANYDPLSRKIVYSNDCATGFPCQVVWKDYEKGFWCATVISTGENGVKTYTPQQLTEDYCDVKCMNEIEKAIMSGQIVLLKD